MLSFAEVRVMYNSNGHEMEMYNFQGTLIATKNSLVEALTVEDQDKLEFLDINIYRKSDSGYVLAGFSPFCNRNYVTDIKHPDNFNLNDFINTLTENTNIGDDLNSLKRLLNLVLQKIKEFSKFKKGA